MIVLCPHCHQPHPRAAIFCPIVGWRIRRARRVPLAVFPIAAGLGVLLIAAGLWLEYVDVEIHGLSLASLLPPSRTPTPTPSRTPSPTPTPTATRTPTRTPTVTPTPEPSPTLTPTHTRTLTPSPAPLPSLTPPAAAAFSCDSQPTGGFASLWSRYQADLGCPLYASPRLINDAEQVFQNGHMFWRADVDVFYVVYDAGGAAQGGWAFYGGKYNENGLAACSDAAPSGLVKPIRGFGNVWCGLGGAGANIGWGLDREWGLRAVVQDFRSGVIFQDSDGQNRGFAYVLFDSGRFIRTNP